MVKILALVYKLLYDMISHRNITGSKAHALDMANPASIPGTSLPPPQPGMISEHRDRSTPWTLLGVEHKPKINN